MVIIKDRVQYSLSDLKWHTVCCFGKDITKENTELDIVSTNKAMMPLYGEKGGICIVALASDLLTYIFEIFLIMCF